eukprot:COSAG01_NODE_2060_length_8520_cov_4.178839_17_plen_66_part_00
MIIIHRHCQPCRVLLAGGERGAVWQGRENVPHTAPAPYGSVTRTDVPTAPSLGPNGVVRSLASTQ